MTVETAKIGEGIYAAADIAGILGIPKRKVGYWLRQYAKTKLPDQTGLQYHFNTSGQHTLVNFFTLIEIYIFYTLRSRSFTSQKILKAHQAMAGVLATPYPFAHGELLISGGDLLFESGESVLSANRQLQYEIREIIRPYAEKIEFGNDNIAKMYFPLGKESAVVVSPQHQFGEPVIRNTNITVETLYNLFQGGESPDRIAELYQLETRYVEEAIRFAEAA